jgi:hypothetical protein
MSTISFTKSKVTDFEKRYIDMFLNDGYAALPSRDASDWTNSTREQFQFVCDVRERLEKFYELYSTPIEFPQESK